MEGLLGFEDVPVISVFGREMLLFAPFGAKVWSVGNLGLAVFGIVFILAAAMRAIFQKKREFNDDDNYANYSEEISQEIKKKIMWLPVSFIAGMLSVFLFLIMQDRSQTMVMTDFWTVVHVVLLTAEIAAVVLAFKKGKKAASAMREIEQNAMALH